MRCYMIMQDTVQFAPAILVGSGREIPAYLNVIPVITLSGICSVSP